MGLVVRVGEHPRRPDVPAGRAAKLHGDVLYDELRTLEYRAGGDYPVGERHLLLAEVGEVADADGDRIHLLDVVLGQLVYHGVHDACHDRHFVHGDGILGGVFNIHTPGTDSNRRSLAAEDLGAVIAPVVLLIVALSLYKTTLESEPVVPAV